MIKQVEQKLMVVSPDQKEIILDMLTEKEIPLTSLVYKELGRYINLENWRNEYSYHYRKWLEEDAQEVFDIRHPLNAKMISAISEYNKTSDNKLYYWFDVNRDENPD